MNRRDFLRLVAVAPIAAPAMVQACVAAVQKPPVNPLDLLNAVTSRYIKESAKLVDAIFQGDAMLLSFYKGDLRYERLSPAGMTLKDFDYNYYPRAQPA